MDSRNEEGEGQLRLWEKLNQLYPEKRTGGNGSPADGGQWVEVPASARDTDGKDGDTVTENRSGFSESPGYVNELCAECDRNCKQQGDKFINQLCPMARMGTGRQVEKKPGPPVRPNAAFEKNNPTCSKCTRNCKQSTVKFNIMLCPGFEPAAAPPPGTRELNTGCGDDHCLP